MGYQLVAVVFFWVIYLALLPTIYFWLRLVWRVLAKRDYSEVALRKGLPPPHPERVAPYFVVLNSVAALVLLAIVFYVPAVGGGVIDWSVFADSAWGDRLGVLAFVPALAYQEAKLFGNPVNWVAVAGSTIWIKIMLGWAIARQAHLKAEWAKKTQEHQRKAKRGASM